MSTVMMICQRTALLKARLIVEFVTLSIIEPLNATFARAPKKARAFSTIPSPQVKRIYGNFHSLEASMHARTVCLSVPPDGRYWSTQ